MVQFQMSNKPYQFIAIVLILVCLLAILSTIADAYNASLTYPINEDEIFNSIFLFDYEKMSLSKIRYHLRENGWVKDTIDEDELDYILVLTRHLSTYYDNVDPNLIIAMIAVESRFDKDAICHGARGLMQLLSAYHSDRLIQFIEEDEKYTRDLFYDPRLNIMTGIDYMSYILGEVNGDVSYALMWYNQGAISASMMYEIEGKVSKYAIDVQKLYNELELLCKN